MTKHGLTPADLEAQSVRELPDRELLGYVLIDVAVTAGSTAVIERIANTIFDDWQVSVLDDNSVKVTVGVVEDWKLGVFCQESVDVLSARCRVHA
jgi:hypothetical protein